jgi:hypothetical protein
MKETSTNCLIRLKTGGGSIGLNNARTLQNPLGLQKREGKEKGENNKNLLEAVKIPESDLRNRRNTRSHFQNLQKVQFRNPKSEVSHRQICRFASNYTSAGGFPNLVNLRHEKDTRGLVTPQPVAQKTKRRK